MTDYDLRTRKALRRVVLLEYGFGPETLAASARSARSAAGPTAPTGHALRRLRRGPAGEDPLRLLPRPPPLLPPAAAWWSPTWRFTAPSAARACPRRRGDGGRRDEPVSTGGSRRRPRSAAPVPAMTRRAADWLRALGGCRPIAILSDDCEDVVWQCAAEQADLLLLETDFSDGVEDKDVSARCDIAVRGAAQALPKCRVYLLSQDGLPGKAGGAGKGRGAGAHRRLLPGRPDGPAGALLAQTKQRNPRRSPSTRDEADPAATNRDKGAAD